MTRGSGDGGKAEQVYRLLKAQIEDGALLPGEPLVELTLVERTGASRTPVREALRRLAATGLVEIVPRQGARVSRISLRGVRDLFEFRTLLEPEAIRQATTAVTADDDLRATFEEMRAGFDAVRQRAPSPARSHEFYALADRFDWTVNGATRNEHLRRTVADLRSHTARLRNLSHHDPERIESSVVEHLQMCDAVLAGDGDAAADACARHLAQSLRTILGTLSGAGDDAALRAIDVG